MKRILIGFAMVMLASMTYAQLFVGGNVGLWAGQSEEYDVQVDLSLVPEVGYAFNDKVAIIGQVGIDFSTNTKYTHYLSIITGAKCRYTPWHNDLVFVDLNGVVKFETDINFYRSSSDVSFGGATMGVQPAVRFRLGQHFDLSMNLGILGVKYYGEEGDLYWNKLEGGLETKCGWGGGFLFDSSSLGVSLAYVF